MRRIGACAIIDAMTSSPTSNLTASDIVSDKALRATVKNLYLRAFPERERYPFKLLAAASHLPHFEFTAYLDEDRFCGFTFNIISKVCVYVGFLATDDSMRSKGYGSAILAHVKESNQGKPLCLEIEPVDESAPNYEQRLRRLSFYQRNGFKETDYITVEGTEIYTLLSTNGNDFDPRTIGFPINVVRGHTIRKRNV